MGSRTGARIIAALLANAVALLLAAWLLDDMAVDTVGFILAVVLFTIVSVVTVPIAMRFARERGDIVGVIATLVGVWLALLVTDVLIDGFNIEGTGTWILATLIVWAASIALELIPGPWRAPQRTD